MSVHKKPGLSELGLGIRAQIERLDPALLKKNGSDPDLMRPEQMPYFFFRYLMMKIAKKGKKYFIPYFFSLNIKKNLLIVNLDL